MLPLLRHQDLGQNQEKVSTWQCPFLLKPQSEGLAASLTSQTATMRETKKLLTYFAFKRVISTKNETSKAISLPIPPRIRTKRTAWRIPVSQIFCSQGNESFHRMRILRWRHASGSVEQLQDFLCIVLCENVLLNYLGKFSIAPCFASKTT